MRMDRRLCVGFSMLPLLGTAWAAQPPPQPAPQVPQSARQAAQTDLTGIWVAQINEDWRWRMRTAPVGDIEGVPLNPAGRELASKWSLEADNASGSQCKAFGAGGIMRLPTRVRVSWADDNTLKFEMDAGTQTRVFNFAAVQPSGERTLQGFSVAQWMRPPPVTGGGPILNQQFGLPGRTPQRPAAPAPAAPSNNRGSLKVVTTNVQAGYLRKNGIPYSERAVITEYYDRVSAFGADYMQVVTIVDDPTFLVLPFVVSSQFKREADGSKFNPTPCHTEPPVVKRGKTT
jgi:hypothetical protein